MLDFLIVGSGLYGSVLAHELNKLNYRVRVIEKRDHIGGNCFTENIRDIHVHKYGPHYFHTNNKSIWDYVNKFTEFSNISPRVKVCHQDQLYSFPVNLFTLYQLYGVKTPNEAKLLLEHEREKITNPANMEEFVVSKIGWKLYRIFYEGYSTKQWGKHPSQIPASIARRIPIRFTMDDSYYLDSKYQGVPVKGYTDIFNNMLADIDVELNVNFNQFKSHWRNEAKHLIYTGCIDDFFDFQFGRLEYRSLKHDTQILEDTDFQGAIQINYTDLHIPYTRIIEHKHFQSNSADLKHTVVTHEYPENFDGSNDPFYPISDECNNTMYHKYRSLLCHEPEITIGGRLGSYKYIDMDDTIAMALNQVKKLVHS